MVPGWGKTTNLSSSTTACQSGAAATFRSRPTTPHAVLRFPPVDLGQVNRSTTRFHLYTVPGQV
jgi:hypothetical protein